MSDTEKTAMTSEIERLRERAAASEAALEAARSLLAMLRSDLQGCELSLATTERRALKAEAERDAALVLVEELREGGGLCSAPSCEGHCGYVHARGCEAVREYLADHGGEPYRAPSPPDILRLAKRAAENAEAAAQLEIADAELRRSLVRNIITAFSPGCRLPDEEDLDWKEATRG